MPMTTKLRRLVTYHDGLLSIKPHKILIMWPCNITCDKLKPLYLNYHSAYSYQTRQGGDLPLEAVTHKVK